MAASLALKEPSLRTRAVVEDAHPLGSFREALGHAVEAVNDGLEPTAAIRMERSEAAFRHAFRDSSEQLDDGCGMSPTGEFHEHDAVLFRVTRIDAIDRHRANGSPRYRAKRV